MSICYLVPILIIGGLLTFMVLAAIFGPSIAESNKKFWENKDTNVRIKND